MLKMQPDCYIIWSRPSRLCSDQLLLNFLLFIFSISTYFLFFSINIILLFLMNKHNSYIIDIDSRLKKQIFKSYDSLYLVAL